MDDIRRLKIPKGYIKTVPTGKTVKNYEIAIDENGNAYKSNTISYTGKALYLYNEG